MTRKQIEPGSLSKLIALTKSLSSQSSNFSSLPVACTEPSSSAGPPLRISDSASSWEPAPVPAAPSPVAPKKRAGRPPGSRLSAEAKAKIGRKVSASAAAKKELCKTKNMPLSHVFGGFTGYKGSRVPPKTAALAEFNATKARLGVRRFSRKAKSVMRRPSAGQESELD